jgi:hypothetical protein
MSKGLPVSSLVNVSVNLAAQPATAQNLTNLLIVGSSDVIDTTQRIRIYDTLTSVATDFGTSAPEYHAAVEWFGQSPQPGYCLIGQWAKTATSGRLQGGVVTPTNQKFTSWSGITDGGFKVTIDGGSETSITGLDFTGVTTMNGVASVINAAFTGSPVDAAITWFSTNETFVLKSSSTGTTSSVSFLTAPASGTDISGMLAMTADTSGAYAVDGVAAEDAVDAVVSLDDSYGQLWYGVVVLGIDDDSDHLDIAEFIEGSNTKHFYGITHSESGVLTTVDTTNVSYQLKQLGYRKTATQYSAYNPYAVCSLLGRIFTTDYTANNTVITLMYKQEPGVVAETLTGSQIAAVTGNNCNVFVNYDNDTAIIQNGVCASGDFIDTICGADWLAITIMNTIYNLLYSSSTKIPQTDDGNQIIVSGITQVLTQGDVNGLLAPGTWTQAGFGKLKYNDFLPTGFYIYAPPVATQNPADRAARKSVTFQVAAKLAGAIHTVDVIVNINR